MSGLLLKQENLIRLIGRVADWIENMGLYLVTKAIKRYETLTNLDIFIVKILFYNRNINIRFLSFETAGGFTGVYYGIFVQSEQDKASYADFDWFEYSPVALK